MMEPIGLADLLEHSARRDPHKIAIVVPNGETVTYARLSELSDRVRDRLGELGVVSGDRVALYLHKSAAAVAAIFGVLKTGAAYIPIDADCPETRAEYIITDCRVKALITDRDLQAASLGNLEKRGALPAILVMKEGGSNSLEDLLNSLARTRAAAVAVTWRTEASDLAYILYTSGSTGNPKGVMLTHGNALSFIDWSSEKFDILAEDRIASHAPFHFDLSVFDIFIAMKHGCALVLLDEVLGKQAMRLAQVIANERITIWYSTPSILAMLAAYGKMHLHEYSSLRLILFAGEVFPVSKYLSLRKFWRHTRCFNLYGPTETNVCTWYELPSDGHVAGLPAIPIGKICHPNHGMLVDERNDPVSEGEGELVVSGPNVMHGYWNRPESDARAFFLDSRGIRWYRTGDIVVRDARGDFVYVGRRDRMVKKRGYRIELGEIEAALLRMDIILEAAVVAIPDVESGVRTAAFIARAPGCATGSSALKAALASALPRYMIPDDVVFIECIPRTSTDKTDYEELKRRVARSRQVEEAVLPHRSS